MPSDRIFFRRLRVFPTQSASLLDSSTTALVLAGYQRKGYGEMRREAPNAEFNFRVYYFVIHFGGKHIAVCEGFCSSKPGVLS